MQAMSAHDPHSDSEDGSEAGEECEWLLGFVEPPRKRTDLLRHRFPSKVGGRPAWLDPLHLPTEEQLTCRVTGRPLDFLLQVCGGSTALLWVVVAAQGACDRCCCRCCCRCRCCLHLAASCVLRFFLPGHCHSPAVRGQMPVLQAAGAASTGSPTARLPCSPALTRPQLAFFLSAFVCCQAGLCPGR